MLPKPPSSTTAPSRIPAMACAIDCTILLIMTTTSPLVLAKAGTQNIFLTCFIYSWIPACAGMSGTNFLPHHARSRRAGKSRHHLAGETAQAVLAGASAAVEQYVANAE